MTEGSLPLQAGVFEKYKNLATGHEGDYLNSRVSAVGIPGEQAVRKRS